MLSFTILRDCFFENELVLKYDLLDKATLVLCKVCKPDLIKNAKWLTEAEIRKNTSILSGEVTIICSLAERAGILRTKFEYGKIKYQFNPDILSCSEEQIRESMKALEKITFQKELLEQFSSEMIVFQEETEEE